MWPYWDWYLPCNHNFYAITVICCCDLTFHYSAHPTSCSPQVWVWVGDPARPLLPQVAMSWHDPVHLLLHQGAGQCGGAPQPGGLAVVPPGQAHTGVGLGGKVPGGAVLAGNTSLTFRMFCLVFSVYLTDSIQPGIFFKQRCHYLGDSWSFSKIFETPSCPDGKRRWNLHRMIPHMFEISSFVQMWGRCKLGGLERDGASKRRNCYQQATPSSSLSWSKRWSERKQFLGGRVLYSQFRFLLLLIYGMNFENSRKRRQHLYLSVKGWSYTFYCYSRMNFQRKYLINLKIPKIPALQRPPSYFLDHVLKMVSIYADA